MYKTRHDSIMRPPQGKKNMPWRVADTETVYDRIAGKWSLFRDEHGMVISGHLKSDPTWLFALRHRGDHTSTWMLWHAGELQGCFGTREQALYYPLNPKNHTK